MKFLCLIYHDEAELSAFTAAQMKVLDHDSEAYDRTLEQSGHMIFAHALRPARTARTLKVRGKKPIITDGPFAESKEQLIGFILIEAQDHDQAMRLATEIPLAKTGTVEVRPAFDPFAK